MNGPDVLSAARLQLAQQTSTQAPTSSSPLSISPWIAMSLLQKAIRRSQHELAQRAASTLLQVSPDRLWRRLGCIAYEDIGVADIKNVSLVTAALAGKRSRAQLGGEWSVASFLVSRMVSAAKCRAADDLLLTVEQHPSLQRARRELAEYSTRELIDFTTATSPLPERALALWYALGTDRRPSSNLAMRRGDPQAVFDHLCEAGFPHSVVEMSREAFRKVGEVLCPLVSLLCPMRQQQTAVIEDDEFPPETMTTEVPSWALDMYTREGRAALKRFLEGNSDSARWVRAHIPPRKRIEFLGTVVFRIEGGLVRSRLRWQTADELRKLVDLECHGPHCHDAAEILHLMRSDIGLLNAERSHVL